MTSNPTKDPEFRAEIYRKMTAHVRQDAPPLGLCHSLNAALRQAIRAGELTQKQALAHCLNEITGWPELLSRKPKKPRDGCQPFEDNTVLSAYWFDPYDLKSRLRILKDAIAEATLLASQTAKPKQKENKRKKQ